MFLHLGKVFQGLQGFQGAFEGVVFQETAGLRHPVDDRDTVVRIEPVGEGVVVEVDGPAQRPVDSLQVFHQEVDVLILDLQTVAVFLVDSELLLEDEAFGVHLVEHQVGVLFGSGGEHDDFQPGLVLLQVVDELPHEGSPVDADQLKFSLLVLEL